MVQCKLQRMNGKKIAQISAILYVFAYFAAMVAPRKTQEEFNSSGFLAKLLHGLLYYSGPLEPVANFFFLVPIFAFLVFKLGRSKSSIALFICIGLSATSEMLQIFIPGRVSSLQDFILNSLGAFTVFMFDALNLSRKPRP